MGAPGGKAEMRFYQGHTVGAFRDAYGLKKPGVEHCKPLFTRGHLVDIMAVKGRMMEAGEEISVADLRAALAKQNLKEEDLCLTGADTWAVEVVPNPDKTLAFAVHMTLQTKHGILNHENLVFDDLIADKKYQFVYVFTPVP